MENSETDPGRRLAPQILVALQEVITGGSATSSSPPIGIYRSGPDIVRFFKRNGYEDSYESWSRVSHTEEKLDEIHAMADGRERIFKLVQDAVNPADYVQKEEALASAIEFLNRYLSFEGLELRPMGSGFAVYETSGVTAAVTEAQRTVDELDFDACRREFDRALSSLQNDPAVAITAASSTLESIAKTILLRLGEQLPTDQTVGPLVRAVLQRLSLLPENQDDQDVRRMLGGLSNVTAGIGAVRTKLGSAHGRGTGHIEPGRDLAALCVNSASAAALFLLHRYAADVGRQRDGST